MNDTNTDDVLSGLRWLNRTLPDHDVSGTTYDAIKHIEKLEARNKELEGFLNEVMDAAGSPYGIHDASKEHLYETALRLSKEAINNE